jgi:adenine-specific DNA-methyltransferase
MEKITQGHPMTQSPDFVKENIETLKSLFPTIVKEDKIDWNELQALLGNEIETEDEYYRFTWAGKSMARKEANKPSTATLRPNKADSKDWDTTKNIVIEGDNLEVLKLLQKSYANKIKMIYIDPPYNTGNDFVYKDNYADNLSNYLAITGQLDDFGKRISTNTESDGRFHSNWLNMMYPRLKLARNLICEDGLIFISIDDNEVVNLRKLCEEVFGESNFVAEFPRITKKAGKTTDAIAKNNDYVVCFCKSDKSTFNTYSHTDDGYKHIDSFESVRGKYKLSQTLDYGSIQYSPSLDYEIELENLVLRAGNVTREAMEERKKRNPKSDFCWRWSKELYEFGLKNDFIVLKESKDGFRIYTKTYEKAIISKGLNGYYIETIERTKSATSLDFVENEYSNDNSRKDIGKIFDTKVFDYSKPVSLLKTLSFLGTDKDSIILDFFAGSGTIAQAVMQLNSEDKGNRKFVCVQLPEPTDENSDAKVAGYKTIVDITRERVCRAGSKIKNKIINELDNLKQSIEGKILQEEIKEQIDFLQETIDTLDIGFKAFKLDSSNIKAWDGNPENLETNLFNAGNNIKENRTEEDVLFEILLKNGLDLAQPIEQKIFAGKTVFNVGIGTLFICLADGVTTEVAEGIGQWKQELDPATCKVIFKDNGFTDVEKTNSMQILKRYGIEEVNTI